ncbi:MAG: ribulose-phosphate 3-epimerase [Atopobiaceae bacterium]|nr:ribulose-phosphate 3-epimerase [Atopobiaceae bacterium]
MAQTVYVSPSILAADFLNLGAELDSVRNADFIHYDVMDGDFVPNISFGPGILRTVKRGTDLPVDVHMMVSNPDEVFKDYLDAGADILTFHLEAAKHAHRMVDEIHKRGRRASVAINPGTAVSSLDAIIDYLDMVLVMSVNPGFSGQRFIEHTYTQLNKLTTLCRSHSVRPMIEIDGGISPKNASQVVAAGANVLVGGSAVFDAPDHAQAVEDMRTCGMRGIDLRSRA